LVVCVLSFASIDQKFHVSDRKSALSFLFKHISGVSQRTNFHISIVRNQNQIKKLSFSLFSSQKRANYNRDHEKSDGEKEVDLENFLTVDEVGDVDLDMAMGK
jgi:hypothetical protein